TRPPRPLRTPPCGPAARRAARRARPRVGGARPARPGAARTGRRTAARPPAAPPGSRPGRRSRRPPGRPGRHPPPLLRTCRPGSPGAVPAGADLGGHRLVGPGRHQAGPLVGYAVDGDQAVEAGADAAEQAARGAADPGGPPGPHPGRPQRRGHALPGRRRYRPPVKVDREPPGRHPAILAQLRCRGAQRPQFWRKCGARPAAGGARRRTSGARGRRDQANRAGANGVGSSSGSAPPISAAISAPVAGARTTPAPSWPQACHRPLTRGSGPITGRWSGTNGRYPWYARTTRTRARNGNSATACAVSRRSTAEEYAGSKPTRSRLDPISTVPDRVGATTAAVVGPAWSLATWSGYSAAYTRRRIGGASRAFH